MAQRGVEISLEGDLLRLVVHGPMQLHDVQALRGQVEQVLTGLEYCYVLADLREMTTIEPEARRFLGEWGRGSDRRAVTAIYGMSFGVRVLLTLLMNAIRVLGRKDNQTRLANTEAEAVRWLDEHRRRAGAAQGDPRS